MNSAISVSGASLLVDGVLLPWEGSLSDNLLRKVKNSSEQLKRLKRLVVVGIEQSILCAKR
jgi:hypothetical protein